RAAALAQPPGFAAALGQHTGLPVERRRAVLEVALRSRPGDLPLLMTLGNSYPINQREGADERVRWLQAASAAHPRNIAAHHNLGKALWDKGDPDGAIAEYREAIRLEPKFAKAHSFLGAILCDVKRDCDGAITAFREAIRLNPELASAHLNLGNALSD